MTGPGTLGPSAAGTSTQAILDAMRAALKPAHLPEEIPTGPSGKERPCLNFHMGLCDGYCRKEMPRSQHQEAMAQAIRLLEGKFEPGGTGSCGSRWRKPPRPWSSSGPPPCGTG